MTYDKPRPRVTPAAEVRRIRAARSAAQQSRPGNDHARGRRDAVGQGQPGHRAFDGYVREHADDLRRSGYRVDPVRRHARLGRVSVIAEPGRVLVGDTARPEDGTAAYTDAKDAFAHAAAAHRKAGSR